VGGARPRAPTSSLAERGIPHPAAAGKVDRRWPIRRKIAGPGKSLHSQARANGVADLRHAHRARSARRLETAARLRGGQHWSPRPRVSWTAMRFIARICAGEAERPRCGRIAFRQPPASPGRIRKRGNRAGSGGAEPMAVCSRKKRVVELARACFAQDVVRRIEGFSRGTDPAPLITARGNLLQPFGPLAVFPRLVYPAPEAAGLGVQPEPSILAGRRVSAPTVEWIERIDLRTSTPARAESFLRNAIRSYWAGPEGRAHCSLRISGIRAPSSRRAASRRSDFPLSRPPADPRCFPASSTCFGIGIFPAWTRRSGDRPIMLRGLVRGLTALFLL